MNVKNKMNNNETIFNNNGDVVNGEKNGFYFFINNFSTEENLIKETFKNENYSEFYKRYMLIFREIEGYTFSLMYPEFNKKNYNFTSVPLIFAKKIIDWIYGITEFPIVELQKFYNELKDIFDFKEDSIIVKRWSANIQYFKGNLIETINKYNELLDESSQNKYIPDWYIDDVCIDGRNIGFKCESVKNKPIMENRFQDYIEDNKHKLAYPDVDRIKSEIFEKVSENIFKNKNKSKNTVIWGNGTELILSKIQNLIFITIFYGSITHLNLTRELIANIMYMYADTFENNEFYSLSLKMLLLSNENKKYKNLYNRIQLKCDFVNSEEFINSIIECRKSVLSFNLYEFDSFVYEIYGNYLKDDAYLIFESRILDIMNNCNEINIISDTWNAISNNVNRISSKIKLLKIIKKYYEEEYSNWYINLENVIEKIDIEKLDCTEFECFKSIIDLILKNIEDIHFNIFKCIKEIKKRNPKIKKYDDILKKDDNIINSDDDYYSSTKKIIDIYRERHNEREKNRNRFVSYSYEYYIIISKDSYNEELRKLLIKNYLPLVNEILSSENEFIYEKIKNIKILSKMLMYEKDEEIRKKIINIVHQCEYCKYCNYTRIEGYMNMSEIDLKISIMMIDVIAKISDYNEVLNQYIEVCINNKENIETVLECIEILNEYINEKNDNEIDKLYILFNICYKLDDIYIRNNVILMCKVLLKTKYKNNILNILENRSRNITLGESYGYINLIRSSDDMNIYRNIIKNMKSSNNYNIRYNCNKYL